MSIGMCSYWLYIPIGIPVPADSARFISLPRQKLAALLSLSYLERRGLFRSGVAKT